MVEVLPDEGSRKEYEAEYRACKFVRECLVKQLTEKISDLVKEDECYNLYKLPEVGMSMAYKRGERNSIREIIKLLTQE